MIIFMCLIQVIARDEKIGHVNAMIKGVHDVITTHNANNNKHVQFGISPTGYL